MARLEGEVLKKDFHRRCRYYKPANPATALAHETVRAKIDWAGSVLVSLCPPGRELSLALTKLEEAMMWANAAIARNQGVEPSGEVVS